MSVDYSWIKVTPVFGRVELRSWFELAPDGSLIGMSQAMHYDGDERITKVVTQPTGVKLVLELE